MMERIDLDRGSDVAAWGEIDAVPDRYPDRARS